MKRDSYRVKITRSGLIYILITIILGVGAANTGNNLLYIMASLMLALMLLSGAASFLNLFFIEISITPPKEVFARSPARFGLKVRKTRGSSFFLGFQTRYGEARADVIRGEKVLPLWLVFEKRGIARIDAVRIHSGFPLGFFRRYDVRAADIQVMIYPKPAHQAFPRLEGSVEGEAVIDAPGGELSDEIRELRDYREHDAVKWIDWKATARRGKTVVREFYRVEGDTLVLDLSRKGAGWERRLSHACFMTLEAERRKILTAVIFPDREIPPGRGEKHKREILEALALA